MRSITEWLAICFVILIAAHPLWFQKLNAQLQQYNITTSIPDREQYHIATSYPGRYPPPNATDIPFYPPPLIGPSPPNSMVNIYQKVFDKYGMIKQANLLYCVSPPGGSQCDKLDYPRWGNKTMNLIDGNPSNGTYLGQIPPENNNTQVTYHTYFKDNLGYTNMDIKNNPLFTHKYNVNQNNTYNMFSFIQGTPEQPHVYTLVIDFENKSKDVTLCYAVDPSLFSFYYCKLNYTGMPMNFVAFLPPYKI
jgi:hypothetical protein